MSTFKPFQHFGTWIRATHRLEDLFPAFIDLLKELEKGGSLNISQEFESDPNRDDDLLDSLIQHLNEYAPAYCYFGAHEGDGSDFGFWVDHFAIEEDIESGELLSVSDLSEIPANHVGDVLLVNDHGNMSLHFIGKDDVLRERWAVV